MRNAAMPAAYTIMAEVVDGYAKAAADAETHLQELEEQVFDDATQEDHRRIYKVRKDIGRIDRAVSSIAAALRESTSHLDSLTVGTEQIVPYLHDLLDDAAGTAALDQQSEPSARRGPLQPREQCRRSAEQGHADHLLLRRPARPADAHRRPVRHELQEHPAGAVGVRLDGDRRGDRRRRRDHLHDVQAADGCDAGEIGGSTQEIATRDEHASRRPRAQNSPVFEILARIGYIVLGIVHIVIGVIAISIVVGGEGEADQDGAMEQIRDTPIGGLLLWIIALGLLGLAIWQITEAVLERNPDTKMKWGYRIKYVATAVVYLAIAWTALVYALGGEADSSEASQSFSALLMATPAGVIVLVLIGLIIGGVGIAFIVRGLTRGFKKHLALPDGGGDRHRDLRCRRLRREGNRHHDRRRLFVIAAVTDDPEKAGGLDGALHALAALPFGDVILWIVGAGLVVYGLFCFGRARYAKM